MKQIITILALSAFCTYGAKAQDCEVKKTVKKTASHITKKASKPQSAQLVTIQQPVVCRVEPYRVCKIMEDRKTVMCYASMDAKTLAPMNDDVTYYGPTGPLPMGNQKQEVRTVFVNKGLQGDFCERDEANKKTICYYNSTPITRDADGNYHY